MKFLVIALVSFMTVTGASNAAPPPAAGASGSQPPASGSAAQPISPIWLTKGPANEAAIPPEVDKLRKGQPSQISRWIAAKKLDGNWKNGELYRAAVEGGNDTVLAHLLMRKVQVPDDLLKFAIEKDKIGAVRLLLTQRTVDPTAKDYEALGMAVIKCKLDIVRLLLANKKVDPTAMGSIGIKFAITNKCLPVVRAYLDDGRVKADTKIDNKSLVDIAKAEGNADIVKLIELALKGNNPTPTTNGPAPQPAGGPPPGARF